MSNENLPEIQLSNNDHKFNQINKLGIILEENNNNNSILESSKRNQKINNNTSQNISLQNHSFNKNISFLKESNVDREIHYQTQNLFFNRKLFNDIINSKNESGKKFNKNNGKYKKITSIKNKSDNNIIILNSGKKKSELIKLISSNNSDNVGKENYTKNINLNININNNIQYEIEKSKEKEEENNELNQSLNSLLKIAEKNCLYFSDTLNPEFYNNQALTVNKNKEKNQYINDMKDKETSIQIKKNKLNSKNKKEKINLSSYSHPIFNKVSNDKKSKINDNKNEKKNEANNIKNENINNDVKKIKTKRIIPTRNNNKIYNRKKSISKHILNKTNRNLSFKLKAKEENPTIYKKTKHVFSIGKIKEAIKENKEGENNYFMNNNELISNNIKTISGYQTSTYSRNSKNSFSNPNYYNGNTFNEINYRNFKGNKISKQSKFFELNVSLDNCFSNKNYFEKNIDYESNKIYKRPTIFNNLIKKVKSLDKLHSHQDINSFNKISSRQNQIKTGKNITVNKTNSNYIISKNEIKGINAYVKKNPQNKLYSSNLNTNINIYPNIKSRNKELYKERNTINNYNINNFNLKKYEDIYNNAQPKHLFSNTINFSTKFQDLLILEEKLCDIILGLKKDRKADNQSLDFFNFYFNFSMYKQIEKVFKNDIDEEIVRLSLNYELISILLCYKFSVNNEIIDISPFVEILQLCHINIINIYEEILYQFKKENNKINIWVEKLNGIVNFSKKSSEHVFISENYNMDLIGKINFIMNCLIKKIKNILYNQKFDNKNIIINFIRNLNQKTYEEINYFFKDYIYVVNNPEGSILPQVFRPIHPNMQCQNYPFIKTPNKKRYSLILDLNETLISLRYADDSKGLIRVRPFLYQFLDTISINYELILFTGSSEKYTNSIVEVLERNKKYFDFIFCRQYLVKCGDCYIKDLSKIGRPLDSTIIIDNNPVNFKLHKENGIFIKSFWGDNIKDTALNDLIPILTNIVKDKKDVRDGISKYKDEIISKISAKIY